MWLEHLFVGLIVAAAVAWAGWALYSVFRAPKGCGCGKTSCPQRGGAPDAT